MFIRQFSLRLLLTIITACAGISLILSFAWRGRFWAISLAVFLLTLLVIVLVQGLAFWLVWLFSVAADRWHERSSNRAIANGSVRYSTRPAATATEPHAAQE